MAESWRNVGKKIRYLRQQHQLTIRQLALGCGLSPNAISLLERGKVAPTIATVCKIASALGIPVSSFFQEICPDEPEQAVLIRPPGRMAGQVLRALACPLEPQSPVAIRDGPEQTGPTLPFGQGVILCLSGRLEFEAGGRCYRLQPGDSITLKGSAWHRWQQTSAEPATVVLVFQAGPLPQKEAVQPELMEEEN